MGHETVGLNELGLRMRSLLIACVMLDLPLLKIFLMVLDLRALFLQNFASGYGSLLVTLVSFGCLAMMRELVLLILIW